MPDATLEQRMKVLEEAVRKLQEAMKARKSWAATPISLKPNHLRILFVAS
jgi:hypothetical protein